MCRDALYVDVTAIYMNTGATVDLFFFSHRFTVGCNLVHLSDALRFSRTLFCRLPGRYCRYSHSSTSIHPSLFLLPLCSGNYTALWGPITEEQPGSTHAFQND